jgi:hypothetical protein
MSNSKKPKRELLIMERPPKPIAEMTDEELHAWASDFADRMALALAEKMGLDPSQVDL